MSRKPKPRRMPMTPKVEPWARSDSDRPPIDQLSSAREDNRRLRIERARHLGLIEELRSEIARLKAERETLQAAIAALPMDTD